jgi:hypothetical protein
MYLLSAGCMAVALFMSMLGHIPEWTPGGVGTIRINDALKNLGLALVVVVGFLAWRLHG